MPTIDCPEDRHEAELERLRAALIEGELSGAATPFDVDAIIARKRAGPLREADG